MGQSEPMELGQGQSAIAVRAVRTVELKFASSGAEVVLPQKALGWLVGVGMRGLCVDVESNHFS